MKYPKQPRANRHTARELDPRKLAQVPGGHPDPQPWIVDAAPEPVPWKTGGRTST